MDNISLKSKKEALQYIQSINDFFQNKSHYGDCIDDNVYQKTLILIKSQYSRELLTGDNRTQGIFIFEFFFKHPYKDKENKILNLFLQKKLLDIQKEEDYINILYYSHNNKKLKINNVREYINNSAYNLSLKKAIKLFIASEFLQTAFFMPQITMKLMSRYKIAPSDIQLPLNNQHNTYKVNTMLEFLECAMLDNNYSTQYKERNIQPFIFDIIEYEKKLINKNLDNKDNKNYYQNVKPKRI